MERHLVEQIMEQGPEHPVGESFVIACYLVLSERHRHQAHFGQLLVQLRLLLRTQLLRDSRPTDPEATRLLVRAEEASGQTARASLNLDSRVGGVKGDGQPVGDDEDTGHLQSYPHRGCRGVVSHESRLPTAAT